MIMALIGGGDELIALPPKTCNTKLIKYPTCLEYDIFTCYFSPHGGSGYHPTPVDTFHPSRLPPSESQTPSKYQVEQMMG